MCVCKNCVIQNIFFPAFQIEILSLWIHSEEKKVLHILIFLNCFSFIFYVYEFLLACMYVHHVCARCLWRPDEGVWLLGTAVRDSCELPWGYWELNLGYRHDQQMLLIAKPFLQPKCVWDVCGSEVGARALCMCKSEDNFTYWTMSQALTFHFKNRNLS